MADDMHEFEKKKLDDNLFIDAKVDKDKIEGLQMRRANMALGDIGNFIKHDCDIAALRECKYMGSMAVHVYQSEMLEQIFFIAQTPLNETREWTADKAFLQLKEAAKQFYGRNTVKRTRSGF